MYFTLCNQYYRPVGTPIICWKFYNQETWSELNAFLANPRPARPLIFFFFPVGTCPGPPLKLISGGPIYSEQESTSIASSSFPGGPQPWLHFFQGVM